MSCLKHGLNTSLAVVILFGSVPALAQATSGYLYVSDNGFQALDRFSYSWDGISGHDMTFAAAGSDPLSPANAQWISLGSSGTGGITGTRNDLIIVTSSGIQRYGFDGQAIGSVQAVTSISGGTYSLDVPGHAAVSADGKYIYVAETGSLTGAGSVDKIDLNSGRIIAQVAFAGAHDVSVLPDGTVVASSVNPNGASAGVYRFDANLVTSRQLVAPTSQFYSQDLTTPTGLTYVGDANSGKLYVQQNNGSTAGAMMAFNVTLGNGDVFNGSSSYQGSASLDTGTGSNSAVKNAFDAEVGADGKLYTAAFGSGMDFNQIFDYLGYTNGIYKYDIQSGTPTSSLAIEGATFGITPDFQLSLTAPNGLYAPKYIAFDNNFIAFNDAGTPEPGTEALMVSAFGAGAIFLRRRRKRVANL